MRLLYGPLSRTRSVWPIALAAFLVGVFLDRWVGPHEPIGVATTFEPFWQAWNIVEKHYVDRQAIQPQRMTYGAIEGMLASLGDVGHTTFLTPGELKELTDQMSGRLQGIGAGMTFRDRQATVLYTIPGSPAQAAGLKPGDVIVKVEDKDVTALPLEQLVRLVRGPPDTTVHLQIRRQGASAPIDLSITRANVEVASVSWRMLPDTPIAHIAIRDFAERSHKQLQTALQQSRQAGAKGLLIDLRGDPGGLKDQAVAVASEFLQSGVVFIEVDAQGQRQEISVKPGGTATDIPLVALIDQGTASSAEILAGALQDHKRAKLVGTRTFGTGTVLRPFTLKDGSAVLLAVEEWLTPDGRQIWHHGITPDVTVELPQGAMALMPEVASESSAQTLAHTSDKQLLAGLDILREQLATHRD